MKKLFTVLLFLVFLVGCAVNQSDWPGYDGTMESYTYFHQDERNTAWEEDILYLAEQFLTNHPLLCDDDFRIETLVDWVTVDDTVVEYSNRFYDPVIRKNFIEQINLLIPKIDSMSDAQILYELQRIVAMLGDCHAAMPLPLGEHLPIGIEPVFEEDGYAYYIEKVPADLTEMLFGRLAAINDIPMEQIQERLAPYISHENDIWVVQQMANGKMLLRKSALQQIGVMGQDDTRVKLTVETQIGTMECQISVVTQEKAQQLEYINGSIWTSQYTAHRYANERPYWYEILGENTLYVRFLSEHENPNESFDMFFIKISNILRDAETPMKLVIDFRNNMGGYYGLMQGLIPRINRQETDGVYILINEGSISAAAIVPYMYAKSIPDAVLVGSPASQSPNMFSLDSEDNYTLPNSGYEFYISAKYINGASEFDGTTLMPDILVYQTIEDYQNGIDTVLEYVLAID